MNMDEINLRQDQVLSELDDLERKISELIEIWTRTEGAALTDLAAA
ncbi:MAG: hypothetical protein P8M80_17990 [Pirellulaceae bacterium]|nr:hypothetical protein [Pirellulaceae bacterium]